jgi:UDP-N-acetyl-D-galactosamine dehydrogenase
LHRGLFQGGLGFLGPHLLFHASPEAAEVVENTQRNLNIALINAFVLILNRLGPDTLEVLEAAGTTWNFLPFRPGFTEATALILIPTS